MSLSQTIASQPVPGRNPIWLVRGTCGGCKGFDVKPGTELGKVKCTKPASPMNGVKVGTMQVNMCHEYEDRTEIPVGFNLI